MSVLSTQSSPSKAFFALTPSQTLVSLDPINDNVSIVKTLLSERYHGLLYQNMSMIFPSLFNYEQVGILFYDEKHNNFYAINTDDSNQVKVYEENIIRFPITIGLTGKAAQKRKIIINNLGDKDNLNYSSEIDNFINVGRIRNMMVGPMQDMKGNIRGIIQFINKKGANKIDQHDEIELGSILSALGEIIKTADETLKITNISAGLQQCLGQINQSIFEKTEIIQTKSIPMISGSVRHMNELVNSLISKKKEAVFSEKSLMIDIFKGIRDMKKVREPSLSSD